MRFQTFFENQEHKYINLYFLFRVLGKKCFPKDTENYIKTKFGVLSLTYQNFRPQLKILIFFS